MPETISSLFRVRNRYLRSVNLERDFTDPDTLESYVLTPQAALHLERISAGLKPNSSQRAWRITGDYGSGKSSFALVLAHLFADNREARIPLHIRRALDLRRFRGARPQLVPVLVTGTREPLAVALLRALERDLRVICARGQRRMLGFLDTIQKSLSYPQVSALTDEDVVSFVETAVSQVVDAGKGTGLLIILDELGKFLEYAALHPDRQDVYILQRLAEVAARSGKQPLFIVGLLHQGFNAYADQLSQPSQKEWEKVAGRFDELLFNQPLEQTAIITAEALNVRTRHLPTALVKITREEMAATYDIGWYGPASSREGLIECAPRLYPLHPTVLPVLVKLFSRFGQNERSLFSFLLSTEPSGLQSFAERDIAEGEFYRIHNLYDYARVAFGHRLSMQSYRSHWNQIDSLVESFPAEGALELNTLKTIGLLNMLDVDQMTASEDATILATASGDRGDGATVKKAIKRLRKASVLHFRGIAGGYCLWPHTSVNLERAYAEAGRALGAAGWRSSALIRTYLETRPLVARRHYIETGNLRHFEISYSPVDELAANAALDSDSADGRIIVALCETEEERRKALNFAASKHLEDKAQLIMAVPKPLGVLTGLAYEFERWQWVSQNTPELNNDSYAAEEVSRQIEASRMLLEKRIRSFIGFQQSNGGSELDWFRRGKKLPLRSGRELLSYLSEICDDVFPQAPVIHNELVNRRVLSSAATAARTRLIQALFSSSRKPYLGMNPSKKPPEMSIYLSVLQESGLHREGRGHHIAAEPEPTADPCRVRPTLNRIKEALEERPSARARVSDVIAELRRPPYGVRDGLAHLLVAAFAVINEEHVAFYENGTFMRELIGHDLMRLTKVPENFEMQYCKLAGVRSELFDMLLELLSQKAVRGDRHDVLDVVRPLCRFAAQLPPYTLNTNNLSDRAKRVRTTIATAGEPPTLLFHDLPKACGFSPFKADASVPQKVVRAFVDELKAALDELKGVYPGLQENMKKAVVKVFDVSESFRRTREMLVSRAEPVAAMVSEPRLKAFALRLKDGNLPDEEWIDSLGSLLCSSPPTRWTDADPDRFEQELEALAAKFKRVESVAFEVGKRANHKSAVRVSITRVDGAEVDNVIYFTEEEELRVAELEAEITSLLSRTKRIGLAATARAFWNTLAGKQS